MAKISLVHPLFVGAWANTAGDVPLVSTSRANHDVDDIDGPADSGDELEVAPQAASVALARLGYMGSASDIPVLLVPDPVALLVFKGSWKKVL